VAEKRYTLAKDYPGLGQPVHAVPGQKVSYRLSIPWQSWMGTVHLTFDKYSRGCCSDVVLPPDLIAQDIRLHAPVVVAQVVEEPVQPVQVPTQQPARVVTQPQRVVLPETRYVVYEEVDESCLTTAQKLSRHFSFIAHASDYERSIRRSYTGALFDYNMPLNLNRGISRTQQYDIDMFIESNRDDALSIYFKQGIYTVDRFFADNGYALVDMISCIRAIQASPDSRITRIIIAGFASPEGSFLFNDRLAWERAVSIKEIILNNTNLPNRTINIYNGSVDWRGLYKLVAESDMYHKYQILKIIDFAPVWSSDRHLSRLDELKRLAGGEPYRYMYNHLFPLLRNAAYIKVYYENLYDPCTGESMDMELVVPAGTVYAPQVVQPVGVQSYEYKSQSSSQRSQSTEIKIK
jgi:hypothetical protein